MAATETVKMSQLTAMQRQATMDYIAAHQDFLTQDPILHYSSCSVDIAFPSTFFSDLKEREVALKRQEEAQEKERAREREKLRLVMLKEQKTKTVPIEAAVHVDPRKAISSSNLVGAQGHRTLSWLLRLIDDVYLFRSKQFFLDASTGAYRTNRRNVVDDLSLHVFQMLSKRFGMPEMVKRMSLDLLDSVKYYREYDHDAQLFSVLLSSSSYDTLDIQMMLDCRSELLPYAIQKIEPITGTSQQKLGTVHRRYIRVCEIPALVRKCLADDTSYAVLNRCRDAYPKWCTTTYCFPAVVPDPNFYCPPFHPKSPYIGNPCGEHLTENEGRFYAIKDVAVVPVAQLLLLLLQNFKAERLQPTEGLEKSCPSGSPRKAVKRDDRASPHVKNASFSSVGRVRTPPAAKPLMMMPPLLSLSLGETSLSKNANALQQQFGLMMKAFS